MPRVADIAAVFGVESVRVSPVFSLPSSLEPCGNGAVLGWLALGRMSAAGALLALGSMNPLRGVGALCGIDALR